MAAGQANGDPSPPNSSRSQKQVSWPVFNIKNYGAKCDGHTDDSAAIRAAIHAANESGIVYIPAGTCVFSTPIFAGKAQIRGVGKNVSILKFTAAMGPAFTFDYPVPMFMLSPGMTNLSLIGPGPNTATTGVLLGGKAGAEGAQFDSVEIAGFGTGIRNSRWVFLTEFRDCYLSNGVDAKLMGSPTAGENMRFVHCTFDHTTRPSSVIVGGGDYMQPEFVDCSFDGAILDIRSGMVSIIGGHFEDTISGGAFFATIGDGRHDANVSIINATLNADGHYSYPSKSLFRVRAGSNLNVEDFQACTLIHNFNVMDVDAGGKGSIINLMVPNCGGWASSPLAATGAGAGSVAQIVTPGSGADGNNVLTRPIQFGKGGPTISSGSGAPDGSCTNGSLYLNSAGKVGSTLYVCAADSWVAAK